MAFPNVMKVAAIGGLLVAALAGPVAAQGSPPPSDLVIDRQTITKSDISAFMNGLFGLRRRPRSPQIHAVSKDPAAMPSEAPLVSYQGRNLGPPARQVIWMSTAQKSRADPRYGEAYLAALALAVMDNGDAGRTLQAIYARTPRDRASRQALGNAFARAFKAVSDQSAALAADEAAWIPQHVVPGTTRAAAYHMLKSKGLTAYNWAFVKGKPISAVGPAKHRLVFAGCDTGDWSSGAWPYMNEPLPKQEGFCALDRRYKPMPNPDAELDLAGAFDVDCGWSTHIVITFNRSDRVATVKVDKPTVGCT